MHLSCLGVMKKLISVWLGLIKNAPLSFRIQNRDVIKLSTRLLSIKPFVTIDFPRRPRGFKFILIYV